MRDRIKEVPIKYRDGWIGDLGNGSFEVEVWANIGTFPDIDSAKKAIDSYLREPAEESKQSTTESEE